MFAGERGLPLFRPVPGGQEPLDEADPPRREPSGRPDGEASEEPAGEDRVGGRRESTAPPDGGADAGGPGAALAATSPDGPRTVASEGSLPFTGLAIGALTLAAVVLLLAGTALRRTG